MKNFLPLLFALCIFSCQRPAADSNDQSSTNTNSAAIEEIPETDTKKAARMQGKVAPIQQQVTTGVLPDVLAIPTPKKLCQNEYGCHNQVIYPIGWSEDGKFAYCYEYAKSAADMFKMELNIVDLNTGELLDRASYKGQSNLTFKEIWTNKKLDFEEAFERFDIKIFTDFKVEAFPMKWQSASLSCSVDNSIELSDYTGKNIVGKSIVTIEGKDVGKKQFLSEEYDKYALILDTEVLGYLKSPFEDRIVVIYAKEGRGFEGPPNMLKYTLVGVDLGAWE